MCAWRREKNNGTVEIPTKPKSLEKLVPHSLPLCLWCQVVKLPDWWHWEWRGWISEVEDRRVVGNRGCAAMLKLVLLPKSSSQETTAFVTLRCGSVLLSGITTGLTQSDEKGIFHPFEACLQCEGRVTWMIFYRNRSPALHRKEEECVVHPSEAETRGFPWEFCRDIESLTLL